MRSPWAGVLALLAVMAAPGPASSQGGSGFRFAEPRATLKFEVGYGVQLANSEIFDMTRDSLTVGSRAFDAPYLGGELSIRVAPRWDVAVSLGFMSRSVDSEFRNWVDLDDNPIEQVTNLRMIPFSLSGKYFFHERGRRIGRFAWVPARVNPYVGAGLGFISYEFEQVGDFVDFETFDIFYDNYRSSGQAAQLRALAGVILSLGGQFALSSEIRYAHASAEMSRDFEGFDPLDLSGFQGTVGIAVRF